MILLVFSVFLALTGGQFQCKNGQLGEESQGYIASYAHVIIVFLPDTHTHTTHTHMCWYGYQHDTLEVALIGATVYTCN